MPTSPSLYRLARPVARLALGLYFRSVERTGLENLPRRGPLLLAANHPQSITDAILLAVVCDRTVHYLAHSGLFARPLTAWFLRSCGVIPIYRPRDDPESAERNRGAFSACFESLDRGGVIGIFPEGESREERRLQALRTGAARIALEAEARRDFRLQVVIVPVGLSFESARRFRSRVWVQFGVPIAMSAYRDLHAADSGAAVRELTDELAGRLRALVVHLERPELRPLVERIERFYHENLLQHPALLVEGDSEFQRRQFLLRQIASAVSAIHKSHPDRLQRLQSQFEGYDAQLRQHGLDDALLREHSRPDLRSRALRTLGWAVAGALPGAYGLFFNWPPYRATGPIAARLARDATKTHYFQLWVGTAAFALYYAAALGALRSILAPTDAQMWLLFLSWPCAGLFARIYVAKLVRNRRLLRLAALGASQVATLQAIRQTRQRQVAELDELLRDYLQARRDAP
jgi:1-acyl-sn-glycerol-3-phosphate acyltransferase